jgi:hypothetical protein
MPGIRRREFVSLLAARPPRGQLWHGRSNRRCRWSAFSIPVYLNFPDLWGARGDSSGPLGNRFAVGLRLVVS